MKRAYINGILLDGTQQMEPQAHKVLLCEDGVITAVADEGTDLDGYEVIDLHGGYAMPGLINLHVHLAGNGKPSAKPRDNAALVRKILSNGLTRAVVLSPPPLILHVPFSILHYPTMSLPTVSSNGACHTIHPLS